MSKSLTPQTNVIFTKVKHELLQRNQAYNITLEYCHETCNDIDELYTSVFVSICQALDLSEHDRNTLKDKLMQLNNDAKDIGTRKLRKAFVDYVLGQQNKF